MKANHLLPRKELLLVAFVFMTVILSVSSCSKEAEMTTTTPQPPVNIVRDSVYLEKIYDLDSVSATRIDTTHLTKFEYDNFRRVVSALEYDYTVSPHVLVDNRIFYYNPQEFLPYKVQLNPATSQFIFYTSTGKVSMDSSHFAGGNYFVRKYIPIPGGYRYETIFRFSAGIVYDTATIMQTLQNGHIVRETKQGRQSPPVDYFYEYDANPNPLKKLNLDNTPILFDGIQQFNQGLDENNLTKTIHQPALSQIVSNHRYLYNATGLPHRVYSYNGNQPPTTANSLRIIRFEYTAL